MGQVKLAATPKGIPRGVARVVAIGALFFPVLLTSPIAAAPLFDTRTGGLALVGPASPHPGSFLYNPAALGLTPGRVFASSLETTVRLAHGSIHRHPIDTNTGEPAAGTSASIKSFAGEDFLEVFPHPMLTVSSSLGSDSVVVSLSGHTAETHRYSFDGGSQAATRYAITDLTQYHLYSTLAASWRVADFLIIGASTSLVWGSLDLGFVRDTALEGGTQRDPDEAVALDDCGDAPCNYESDLAAEMVRVEGSTWGLRFAVGAVVRPHSSLDVGIAYVSRVLGFDGRSPEVSGDASIRRSEAIYRNANATPSMDQVDRDISGRGNVTYALPDALNMGATWRINRRLRLNVQLRWINYSVFDKLSVRLSGSTFRKKPTIPERVVHHRGFQDVWAVQLGGGWRVLDNLELQTALMVETSAVPKESVSPAALDSTKVDTLLALNWRFASRFALRVGYSLAVMTEVDTDESQFSPSQMVSCVDAQYDIDLRACKAAAAGRGLPSMAGKYSRYAHRLGTSLTFHWP